MKSNKPDLNIITCPRHIETGRVVLQWKWMDWFPYKSHTGHFSSEKKQCGHDGRHPIWS